MKRTWMSVFIMLSILICKQSNLVFAVSNINAEKILADHSSWIFSIVVSKDGKYFASASRDKTINIYNSATRSLIKTLNGHKKDVNSICFSPDSRYIVSAGDDSNVLIWDFQNDKILKTFKGHRGIVYSVKYSPDGKYVVSGGEDSNVILWNAKTGKKIKVFSGHNSYVRAVCFSSDSKLVASAGNDRIMRIWSVKEKKLIKVISGITIQKENTEQIDINKKYIFNLQHIDAITDIHFSPDNKYVVTSSFDKTIRVFSIINSRFGTKNRVLAEHNDKVYSLSFSNDGKYMVSAGKDRKVIIWDANTFEVISKFQAHNSWIFTAVFSKDDKYILSAGKEQSIKIWDFDKILKFCKVPVIKPRLLEGKLNWEKKYYFDNQFYIKYLLLKEQNPTGFIYKIFKRKTNSFLMQITIDFCQSLMSPSQQCFGPVVTGITVFPDLKYIFTSTGQNISFFINLEILYIETIKSNTSNINAITKDYKYCIISIFASGGELSSNIGSVAIYEIRSGFFYQIGILEGRLYGYEYVFEKLLQNDTKIVVLKIPHSSANDSNMFPRIDKKYAYREIYSFTDLRLLSSKKVNNPYYQ